MKHFTLHALRFTLYASRFTLALCLSLSLSLILGTATALADGPYVGEIRMWAGSTPPAGWLACQGQGLLISQYSALYSTVGHNYHPGGISAPEYFYLHDLRGRTPTGYDASQTEFNTLGKTGGQKTHTLTANEMPSHNHPQRTLQREYAAVPFGAGGLIYADNSTAFTTNETSGKNSNLTTLNTGGSQAHNVLDPYLTVNFIIYTGVGGPTPTPTATPLATYTPAPTYTPWPTYTPAATYTPVPPAATYTPVPPAPTYTPGPTYTPASYTGTIYMPSISASYTTTLRSGKTLTQPVEVTFGQLIVSSLGLALIAVLVLPFVFGVVFRT